MVRKIVTFDRFDGGEYGLLGGVHPPPHTYTGTNVVPLMDGALCTRSGLLDIGVTGVPVGNVRGFGYNALAGRCWFIVADQVYDFSSTALAPACRHLTGSLDVTPSERVQKGGEIDLYSYITVYGDKSYAINHDGGAVTALTGSPGGTTIAPYGERLVVAGTASNKNRVWYSQGGAAGPDFNSWPVANYFDVGYIQCNVVYIAPFRERIVIALADGSWWMFSGTPGVNDVLRRMLKTLSPGNLVNGPTRCSVAGDGRVWFVPGFGEYPAVFGGSGIDTFEHLTLTDAVTVFADATITPTIGVTGLAKPTDVLINSGYNSTTYDNLARLFHNGVWSSHAFGLNVSGYIDGRNDDRRRAIICDGGDGNNAARFFVWSYAIDRPALASRSWETIGDGSTTVPVEGTFTLPQWWSSDGSEVQLVAVAVDFRKWNHGFAANNAFTVTLTPLCHDGGSAALDGGDGNAVTLSPAFSEATTAASTSGTRDRRRWSLPPSYQFSNGFEVTVSGMVGVAIDRIHVFYDSRPAQGT